MFVERLGANVSGGREYIHTISDWLNIQWKGIYCSKLGSWPPRLGVAIRRELDDLSYLGKSRISVQLLCSRH
jgi:hypothetical protein